MGNLHKVPLRSERLELLYPANNKYTDCVFTGFYNKRLWFPKRPVIINLDGFEALKNCEVTNR